MRFFSAKYFGYAEQTSGMVGASYIDTVITTMFMRWQYEESNSILIHKAITKYGAFPLEI
jgi:hypothetical protein